MRAEEFPFRAVGGNVLLRRVTVDPVVMFANGRALSELRGLSECYESSPLKIGEVLGLGGRWTQDAKWSPPMPTISKARHAKLIDQSNVYQDKVDPDWRDPDLSHKAPRPPGPIFSDGHRDELERVRVGSFVVYNQARVYDHFSWQGQSIVTYPGNWIYAVLSESSFDKNRDAIRTEIHPI